MTITFAAVFFALLPSTFCLSASTTVPYDGPTCTPSALAFKNGDFETGSLAPWSIYNREAGDPLTNFSIVPHPGGTDKSKYALRIDSYVHHFSLGQPSLVQQGLTICPTYSYQISFDYQIISPYPGILYASLGPTTTTEQLGDAQVNTSLADPPGAAPVWKHISAAVRDLYSPTVSLYIGVALLAQPARSRAGPAVLFDNLRVTPLRSLVPAACPREPPPFANPSFASGTLAPWRVDVGVGNATVSVVPRPGSGGDRRALQIAFGASPPAAGGGSGGASVSLAQGVGQLCLGFAYVYTLTYAVVVPMRPEAVATGGPGRYFRLDMPGCADVDGAGREGGTQFKAVGLDVVGTYSVQFACRMRHSGSGLFKMDLVATDHSDGGVVQYLNLTQRLARTDDFKSS